MRKKFQQELTMLKKKKLIGQLFIGKREKFLGKSATTTRYVLLAVVVDLYSSRVHDYLMCSRKQVLQKNETVL